MAKKNKINLKELSTQDLTEKIAEEKVRYQKMKFNHVISPIENPKNFGVVRREIARMKTELRRREMEKTVKQ